VSVGELSEDSVNNKKVQRVISSVYFAACRRVRLIVSNKTMMMVMIRSRPLSRWWW